MSTKLAELKALAQAATKGPWHASDTYTDNGQFSGVDICADNGSMLLSEDSGPGAADAAFIAAANPAVVLDLIAQLEAAKVAEQPECTQCLAKQAKIDALMLEHCPNEMSPEQMAEWGKHQHPVEAPSNPATSIGGHTLEYYARALVAAFNDPTCSLASMSNYVTDLENSLAHAEQVPRADQWTQEQIAAMQAQPRRPLGLNRLDALHTAMMEIDANRARIWQDRGPERRQQQVEHVPNMRQGGDRRRVAAEEPPCKPL